MYQTTIALENMQFYAFHGYYEAERKMGNDFQLSVSCDIGTLQGDTEDIDNTVNYEVLYAICKEVMSEPQKLLETVTSAILDRLKSKYPKVESAKVILQKAQPQVGGRVEWSTITMQF